MSGTVAWRLVAIVLWTIAIFEILGGQLAWREALEGGGTRTTALTIYRGMLAPPPPGPKECNLVSAGVYSLTLPCNYRPPFIDVAKKFFS